MEKKTLTSAGPIFGQPTCKTSPLYGRCLAFSFESNHYDHVFQRRDQTPLDLAETQPSLRKKKKNSHGKRKRAHSRSPLWAPPYTQLTGKQTQTEQSRDNNRHRKKNTLPRNPSTPRCLKAPASARQHQDPLLCPRPLGALQHTLSPRLSTPLAETPTI